MALIKKNTVSLMNMADDRYFKEAMVFLCKKKVFVKLIIIKKFLQDRKFSES